MVLNEYLSNGRSSECGSDTGSSVDSEDDHAILERSDIGSHDVSYVENTNVASPVKDVSGDVGLHVLASGLESHTDKHDEQHEEETLDTTEDIDEFGGSQWNTTGQCGGHDATDVEETVLIEERSDPWVESGIDGVQQESHELNEVKAGFALAMMPLPL